MPLRGVLHAPGPSRDAHLRPREVGLRGGGAHHRSVLRLRRKPQDQSGEKEVEYCTASLYLPQALANVQYVRSVMHYYLC